MEVTEQVPTRRRRARKHSPSVTSNNTLGLLSNKVSRHGYPRR
jgi:hypothetical protein